MAIISFWSNGKSETGKTTALAGIATQLSFENNLKILIINTKHNDISIEDCFWNTVGTQGKLNFKEAGKTDIDAGIKGLSKAILSNRISPETVTNYAKTIFKNRLELLTDTEVSEKEYDERRPLFKEMIKMANKYYDLVFVDLEGDANDKVILEILEISTIIVTTVSQSLRGLNDYVELKKENKILTESNTMLLVGRYDKKSKYNLKNVARYTGEKKTYGIPYSTLYFESCTEGKIPDYFLKFRKAKPTENNGLIIESAREFSKDLIENLRMLNENI